MNAFGFGGINAHVLVEEWNPDAISAQMDVVKQTKVMAEMVKLGAKKKAIELDVEDIAIVGMGAHVGSVDNLRQIQEALFKGEDIFTDRPENRWLGAEMTAWFKEQGLDALPKRCGYVSDLKFDFGKYRISPVEFKDVSIQQALMLKVVDQALKDAKLSGKLGNDTAVFTGIGQDFGATDFSTRWELQADVEKWNDEKHLSMSTDEKAAWLKKLRDSVRNPLTASGVTGNLGGIVASRVAREFNIGGCAFNVASEDNSGLEALRVLSSRI